MRRRRRTRCAGPRLATRIKPIRTYIALRICSGVSSTISSTTDRRRYPSPQQKIARSAPPSYLPFPRPELRADLGGRPRGCETGSRCVRRWQRPQGASPGARLRRRARARARRRRRLRARVPPTPVVERLKRR
jgi:hypothetical protein